MTPRTKAPKGEQYQEALRGELAAYEQAGLYQRAVGPRTAYRYRGALLRYQRALGESAPSLAASQQFLAHLRKREFAPSTLRLYRAALQGFHSWRGEQFIFPVKVPRQVPTYVEANVVERVLELAWQDPRDRLILLLMSDAGLRREEVVNLLVGDVGRDAMRFRGKGDKYRTVPLTSRLAEALAPFCQGKDVTDPVLGVGEGVVYRVVKKYGKQAGRPDLHPHDLRHAFAERLTEAGVPLPVISELMGHGSVATTQLYIGVTGAHLKDAIRRLEAPPPAIPGADATGAATEHAQHRRELFYFGRRLRDRLSLPTPHEVVEAIARGERLAMWSGKHSSDVPRDSEEDSVERDWGFDRCDASTHSLFPAFQQHLTSHPCWQALDGAKDCFRKYEDACQQAHTAVLEKVRERLQDLAEPGVGVMASALLMDAYYRACAPSVIVEFRPRAQSVQHEDGIRWHLPVGSGLVGNAGDPRELKPLAEAYEELARVLPSTIELISLADADRTSRRAINEFQQLLSPDSLLRNMILEGQCDLCPPKTGPL